MALTGNQTLSLVAAMLNEVITRAVTAMAQPATSDVSTTSRRRGLTSQTKLVELIAQGRGDEAELHWRAHLKAVGRIMFGRGPTPTIDRLHHG